MTPRRNPTFIVKEFHGNTLMTCKETKDRFTIVRSQHVWRIYINGCYDTFRNSRADAIQRVEDEARIAMR